MSKDNKTNFLLTPTYSSDMMANSQDEKKKLSNGEKTQLPVSNERKTTKKYRAVGTWGTERWIMHYRRLCLLQ